MSVWDDLKKLFDGVVERVETPLPDDISTGDRYLDSAIRQLIRSGDFDTAIELQMLVKNAQEVRTMERVQQRLNQVDGIDTNEIFDVSRDFNRGGMAYSADSIRSAARRPNFPDDVDVDRLISRAQQVGFRKGDQVFERRVSSSLERTIDDFRFRTTPAANDPAPGQRDYDGPGGQPQDPDSRPIQTPPTSPPVNDNKIPGSAREFIGRWLGRGLKTIIPAAGVAMAAYAVYEILDERGELLDKLGSLRNENLINRRDYDKMKEMIDGVARLRGMLEGVGNLPGVGLFTGIAVDTLGQREVDQQLEAIEEALASYKEVRTDIQEEVESLQGAIQAGRAARNSIENSLRNTVDGARRDLDIDIPSEAEDYIETDRNGRLRLKEGVESPEAERLINGINQQIDQLREGGSLNDFIQEMDQELRDAEGVRQDGIETIRQLDRDIQQLEGIQEQLEIRNRQLNTLSSLVPDSTTLASSVAYSSEDQTRTGPDHTPQPASQNNGANIG